MSPSEIQVGDDARVISGDHEGKTGRVVYMRDVSTDFREAEQYALLEYVGVNWENKQYVDQISVPVRRLQRR
jgi:hypothetical protein